MDSFSVLNYQGSKKNLMEFIHTHAAPYLTPESTVLDIFAGTCSVGYSYKRAHRVYANDSEYYSYIISKALLGTYDRSRHDMVTQRIQEGAALQFEPLRQRYSQFEQEEASLLQTGAAESLTRLYGRFPTIWNEEALLCGAHQGYDLFTTYYAGSYFGIRQSMEIDSLRGAIEAFSGTQDFYALLTALFFAMKECVFSKDGHMAQPLDLQKNRSRLVKRRQKSIRACFYAKLAEFYQESFVNTPHTNRVFNLSFEQLLKDPTAQNDVSFIYADPPYTDMQYSRYYHLLNIVAGYEYPKPTKIGGKYTKGLYTQGRFQSPLSTKSTCLDCFRNLVEFSSAWHKNLAVSFAYPKDLSKQKADRYVMSIDDLISSCRDAFGRKNVEVATKDYNHSNNRNSETKKVLEYLILCRGIR